MKRKLGLLILVVLLGMLGAQGTRTLFNMANDVFGIGNVANGMTGAATTSATYVLSGPASGAAAAYSFKAYPFSQFNGFPLVPSETQSECMATGTSMTCIGSTADSSRPDVLATSTSPSYTQAVSDTTGAGCGSFLVDNTETWYTEKNATMTAYLALNTTGLSRNYWGFVNGGNLFCLTESNIANAIAVFRASPTSANYIGQATDAIGTDVVTCDTTVPIDTNFHFFRIAFNTSLPGVDFFVDDMTTAKCSITSNYPSALAMHWLFSVACVSCGGVAQMTNVASFEFKTDPY